MATNHSDDFWKAVLMYSHGYKQTEIAQALGGTVTQPAVSRYVRDAIKEGYLDWEVRWPNEMTLAKRAEIEESVLTPKDRKRLRDKLDAWTPDESLPVQRLHVVYTNSDNPSGSFGRNAAPYIAGLIASVEICVVAWGRTIRSIVDAINPEMKAKPELKVLPLCGEPLNHTDNAISPSVAASTIARAFKSNHQFSLRGVPARIPESVNPDELRKFVETCFDYRTIFTTDDPLINRVEMVLTSIGNIASSATDPLYRDTIDSEGLDDEHFRDITAGNLGGAWLPADRSNGSHIAETNRVNSRWLGMTKEQIQSCFNRAARHQDGSPNAKPGVVIVASDPEKAQIVRRSLGMVNTLVISRELANALLEME